MKEIREALQHGVNIFTKYATHHERKKDQRKFKENLEHADKLTQALTLLDKMDWQPIETAPKERGLRVLVWSNWFKTPTIAMYQDFGNYQCWEGENGNRKLEPTHWKPLPEKP